MAYYITPADVRNRLRTLCSVEVDDAVLNSTPYIPRADKWLDQRIAKRYSSSGTPVLTDLSDSEQFLAKCAEIAYVAKLVINSAPLDDVSFSSFKSNEARVEAKNRMIKELDKEIRECLGHAGVPSVKLICVGASPTTYSDIIDRLGWRNAT